VIYKLYIDLPIATSTGHWRYAIIQIDTQYSGWSIIWFNLGTTKIKNAL